MSEMSRCHHDRTPQSTLQTCYGSSGDGLTVWWVICRLCGETTGACLTAGEAIARAEHGWWFNIEEGEWTKRLETS